MCSLLRFVSNLLKNMMMMMMLFYDLFVGCRVFTNKDDAIKLIKEKKGGRFKAFSKRVEAEEFSMSVLDSSCSTRAVETVTALVKFCYFFYCLHSLKLLLQQYNNMFDVVSVKHSVVELRGL